MPWSQFSTVPASPIPIGVILPFGGINVPSGWVGCDGSAVSRTTYSLLFNALTLSRTFTTTNASTSVTTGDTTGLAAGMFVEGTGITAGTTISSVTNSTTFVLSANATASGSTSLRFFAFGRGDGSSTFNLPDMRGRSVLGAGTGTGGQNTSAGPLSGSGLPSGGSSLTARVVGQWGGQESHTLTATAMPSHNHGGSTSSWHNPLNDSFYGLIHLASPGQNVTTNGQNLDATQNEPDLVTAPQLMSDHSHTISSSGGDGSHNNIQPFAVTHYIIKAS